MLRQPKQQKRQTLNTLKFQANVYIYVVALKLNTLNDMMDLENCR